MGGPRFISATLAFSHWGRNGWRDHCFKRKGASYQGTALYFNCGLTLAAPARNLLANHAAFMHSSAPAAAVGTLAAGSGQKPRPLVAEGEILTSFNPQ